MTRAHTVAKGQSRAAEGQLGELLQEVGGA